MDPGFYVYFVNEEKTMIDAAEKDELEKLQKLYDVLENEKKELREKYNHVQNKLKDIANILNRKSAQYTDSSRIQLIRKTMEPYL